MRAAAGIGSALIVVALLMLAPAGASAAAPTLHAGAGRADITPPTGYFLLGWARGDARSTGQNTRLFARAIVLERGGQKVALVSEDLNSLPGGMVEQAAADDADIGFSERNVVVSAGHTHGGPSGFSNFLFKDTINPTATTPNEMTSSPDPVLYSFMVHRLALAIRRANANLAPAAAGWGHTELLGVTHNRSLEAHLANFGIHEDPGQGRESQDPGGYPDTIDPSVDVLRVDRVARGRHTPLGVWSQFADHGTVNKPNFLFYNADHHATAERVVEAALRGAGRVPRSRDVVNVYGNADAGDMSAGLDRSGPAAANEVGKREAAAMLAAWRQAGGHLSRSPALDLRWTRVCFCGQSIDGGAIDTMAEFGLPYTTGSEENRGPLFDVTHQSFEGLRAPVATGPQGDKLPYKRDTDGTQVPKAIPLVALRLGDQQVVSVPAEMTVELGRRLRAAVMNATAGFGVVRAVIAGYANEYASYLTTPDEYDAQHYEGGTTVYGRLSGPFFVQQSADLAGRLARGLAAPAPFDFDPTRGMKPSSPPYPPGAAAGSITDQPGNVRRLSRVAFGWRGGESGLDRPLDRAFVTVQRRAGRRWVRVDDDLGLNMLWRVTDDQPHSGGNPTFSADAKGTYQALWQVPLGARPGSYRFLVTANRYRLASRRFRVAPSNKLTAKVTRTAPGTAVVQLAYPPVVVNEDLTDRPQFASSGTVRARAGSRTRTVTIRRGRAVVHVPASATVSVPAGAARDRYGNRNGG